MARNQESNVIIKVNKQIQTFQGVYMKDKIKVTGIKLPAGVTFRETSSAIIFARDKRKAILKGTALEITNPIVELGKRMKKYTEQEVLECHLGRIRGVVSGIEDEKDLANVLAKYYRKK